MDKWIRIPSKDITVFVKIRDIKHITIEQSKDLYTLQFTLYDGSRWVVENVTVTEADDLLAEIESKS